MGGHRAGALGNTITDLTIDSYDKAYIGFFGFSSGAISDIGLIGGRVTSHSAVSTYMGGLVGYQKGAVSRRAIRPAQS